MSVYVLTLATKNCISHHKKNEKKKNCNIQQCTGYIVNENVVKKKKIPAIYYS